MKKRTVLLFFLSLFVFMTFKSNYAFAGEKDYYIRSLNIDVSINDKKQCVVKERVNVHFNKDVDAFYKTVETKINDEDINVSNVRVVGEKFEVNEHLDETNIIIGDIDKGVSKGDKTFFIEYTLDYYQRKDGRNNILDFDVLQDTYQCNINNFYEKINMPSKVDENMITISSDKYDTDDKNELNIESRISGNSIELSKNSKLEEGSKIRLKADFNSGMFKDIPDFKYNYFIKNKDVDIHITRQQEYYITQKYSINIVDESIGDNSVRIISSVSCLDKISDFKCSNKEITFSDDHDTAFLPKKKGHIEFTVTYKQKPSLDEDVKFNLYEPSRYVSMEKMNVTIDSSVPINKYDLDCFEKEKNKIDVEKSSKTINISNNAQLTNNGYVDIDIDVDKRNFKRPMKVSSLIEFFAAAAAFFISFYLHKKYSDTKNYKAKKRYYAPEFMDSLKAAFIFNGYISKKNASTLIFYWQSHKHIAIDRLYDGNRYSYKISKLEELDDKHQDYEVQMFTRLFSENNEVIVNRKNAARLMDKLFSSIKTKFSSEMKKEGMINKKPTVLSFFINIFTWISVTALIYDRINENSDMFQKFIVFGLSAIIVFVIYGWVMKSLSLSYRNSKFSRSSNNICKVLFTSPFFLILCFMFCYKTTPVVITALTIVFLLVAVYNLKCPIKGNEYYKEKIEYLLGLGEFLDEKETADFNLLINDDMEYGIKMLPFAIALGKESIYMQRIKRMINKNASEKINDYYILNCIFNNRDIL